jgi:hypothetical protein
MASRSSSDFAQTIALRALAQVLSDDDQLQAFMAFTGSDGAEMAADAKNPAFLGAVLDFILQEDQRVIDLATACDMTPQEIAPLRMALPGWGG